MVKVSLQEIPFRKISSFKSVSEQGSRVVQEFSTFFIEHRETVGFHILEAETTFILFLESEFVTTHSIIPLQPLFFYP